MRYALIDLAQNLVVNVVKVEPNDGSATPDGFLLFASPTAGIGDSWDGANIVPAPRNEDGDTL